MQTGKRSGFTLLEMSLVLIIIGVIIGGIMYAKSMVTASKLQTVIADVDSYASAVANFKQQYNGLPGDLPNAGKIWGYVGGGSSCNSSQNTTQGTGTQTCDGNGDGMIDSVTGNEFEVFRFWQQLYNAGMMNQYVTGVNNGSNLYDASPGINVPVGPIKGTGYSAQWYGNVTTGGGFFGGYYGNVIIFGGIPYGTNSLTYGPIITADQAAAIDTKMDDGLPAYGKVRAPASGASWNGTCTTTSTASTAKYNVYISSATTDQTYLCTLYFVMGF